MSVAKPDDISAICHAGFLAEYYLSSFSAITKSVAVIVVVAMGIVKFGSQSEVQSVRLPFAPVLNLGKALVDRYPDTQR